MPRDVRIQGSPARPTILYLIGEIGHGGAELLVTDLAIWMRRLGYDVHVAVLGYQHEAVTTKLAGSGVSIHLLEHIRSRFAKFLALRRLVKKVCPDILHGHLFPALYFAPILKVLAGPGPRLIYTEHSTSNRRRGMPWLRQFEKGIYRRYRKVICVSPAVRESLLAWIGTGERLVEIENGIDLDRFHRPVAWAQGLIDRKPGDFVVGAVGALREEKNYPALVEAFSRLPVNFRLAIAGQGAERGRILEACAIHGVEGRVQLLGIVEDIPGFLASIDACALVSKAEGFGLSALEALAAGCPLVYSDVPGLAEVVGLAGIPVDPRNVESIAAGIREASVRDDEWRRRCEAGKVIARRYSFESMASRHEALYAEVLSQQ